MLLRAIEYRDPSYHYGVHDGFASSDAILHAIERLTDVGLLTETYECCACDLTGESLEDMQIAHTAESPCRDVGGFQGPNAARRLWESDPESLVNAYLATQFTAEEGDTLHWGAGSLTYTNGHWQ